MRFSLLGPLEVTDSAGSPVAPGGPRLRVLLAALLVRAGVPVPAGELAEAVWDGTPPSGASSTLRSYVRRLRQALGDDATRIVACGPGYLIHAGQAELDILEFEQMCRDARAALRAGQWTGASAAAVRALGLWRAAPLLDVASEVLRGQVVPRLDRLRLQVLKDRFDAGLRLGCHQELVPELLDTAARHPLEERFHAQLMLALAGAGQRAQALQAYQEARRVLVDELGIEPGAELRDIHRQILAGDAAEIMNRADAAHSGEVQDATAAGALAGFATAVAPVPASAGPASAGPASAGPAQLPADIADFTGREAEASDLYNALTGPDGVSGPGVVRAAMVAGPAGIGKTALAVHVAHQVREFFPDGQLQVNLAGASAQPAVPAEVLARFLRDLGVDDRKIPAAEEERAALYRTWLVGRRVLILLDDAKDAAQIRPLLPGSASCAVLVTTRNRALKLLGTRFVELGTLPDARALELFSRVAGDARAAAEPEAAAEILRACAGMPLAVRICAARLATRPQWRIATMAARLRDEQRRLDEFQLEDLGVRASFQVSFNSLPGGRYRADPARAFRLLGLWQGHRISLPAAAALTGEQEADVAGALEALVDANLLESPEPDWYQLHDLLRLFAAERARDEQTREARLEAVTRLLQWYLAAGTAAADQFAPRRYRLPDGGPPASGTPRSALDGAAWYDNEQANLIAVIRQAAAAGLHDAAWRLPTALFPFFNRCRNWAGCVAAHRIAVDSARVTGSRLGEAWALHNLGQGLAKLCDADAFGCLQEASAIRRAMNDPRGEAQTAIVLTEAHLRIHGPKAAYEHSLRSLELLRNAGNPTLLASGLNNHGDICLDLGKADEAAECLQEALGTVEAIGGGYGKGQVMENIGRVHLDAGRLPEAITSLSEAQQLHLAQGDRIGHAEALTYLAEAQRRAGRIDQARESLQAALTHFSDLGASAEAQTIQSAIEALA